MFQLVILAFAWILFCFLHSFLISPSVSSFFQRRMRNGFVYYRLIYNFASLMTLTPILLYWQSLESEIVFEWSGNWIGLQFFLWILAAVYIVGGFISYDGLDFLGFRQIREPQSMNEKPEFRTRGIHRYVRHPWYAAVLILVWARDLNLADLVTAVILTLYIFVGTWLEERKMISSFGEEYRKYRRQVPAYYPSMKLFR